jgi:hypothetical protein
MELTKFIHLAKLTHGGDRVIGKKGMQILPSFC